MTGDDAKRQEQPQKQSRKKERKLPDGVRPLLTPEQVAKYTGLSVRTIYKYCRPEANPQIPHYRTPDGGIRIDLDDLKRWLSKFKNRPRTKRVKKLGLCRQTDNTTRSRSALQRRPVSSSCDA